LGSVLSDEQPLQVVFLCGARDFHAMDWYRSAVTLIREPRPIIVTDLIEAEGFKKLIDSEDIVYPLLVLDKYLFRSQSRFGHVWRNVLKAIVFPIQVILLRRFAKKHKNALYYPHAMYYLWLAWAARVPFVGTPQGSDVLVNPKNSWIYKTLSTKAMKAAILVTVDSEQMADEVQALTGTRALVIQNGIDLQAIDMAISKPAEISISRDQVTSFRGLTPLYRIYDILKARNQSSSNYEVPISFVYPFYESEYQTKINTVLGKNDALLGRLSKQQLYTAFAQTVLSISIPTSDSSPRSVYEAIFCGAIVAIAWQPYYETLPTCMKERIVLVQIGDSDWFDQALTAAKRLTEIPFVPSEEALDLFDQFRSFSKLHTRALQLM
jgi:hypothetical protein